MTTTKSCPMGHAKRAQNIVVDDGVVADEEPALVCPFGASFKPKHKLTYASLISMAIEASPNKRLMLHDIYAFVQVHRVLVPTASHPNWKNSVRHNLSLRSCFRKVPRWASDGKKLSAYWELEDQSLPPAAVTVLSQMKFAHTTMPQFPFKNYSQEVEEEDASTTAPVLFESPAKAQSISTSAPTPTPKSTSITTIATSSSKRRASMPATVYTHPTPDASDVGSDYSDSDRENWSDYFKAHQRHQQHHQAQMQQQWVGAQPPQQSSQSLMTSAAAFQRQQQQQYHHQHQHQHQHPQQLHQQQQQYSYAYPAQMYCPQQTMGGATAYPHNQLEQYHAAAQLFHASQNAHFHHSPYSPQPHRRHSSAHTTAAHTAELADSDANSTHSNSTTNSATATATATPPASPRGIRKCPFDEDDDDLLHVIKSNKRLKTTFEADEPQEDMCPPRTPTPTSPTPTSIPTPASSPPTISITSEATSSKCPMSFFSAKGNNSNSIGMAILAQAASSCEMR